MSRPCRDAGRNRLGTHRRSLRRVGAPRALTRRAIEPGGCGGDGRRPRGGSRVGGRSHRRPGHGRSITCCPVSGGSPQPSRTDPGGAPSSHGQPSWFGTSRNGTCFWRGPDNTEPEAGCMPSIQSGGRLPPYSVLRLFFRRPPSANLPIHLAQLATVGDHVAHALGRGDRVAGRRPMSSPRPATGTVRGDVMDSMAPAGALPPPHSFPRSGKPSC